MSENQPPATTETINQIIVRSNLPDLTPETLLASFKEEGIRSLEDLAKRLVKLVQDPEGLPQRINYEGLFTRPTPKDLLATIEHQVPKVPFVVDGVEHDPEDIVRYNGQELGFIPQNGGTELLVLKDKSIWGPFLRTAMLARAVATALTPYADFLVDGQSFPTPQHARGVSVPPEGPNLVLWTDEGYRGSALVLRSGESRRNLLEVGDWPWLSDFNDKFTSMYPCTSLAMAFEHIHFQGSYLWCGPNGIGAYTLWPWGWSDRISSVINSG